MRSIRVKICGLTREEDLAFAVAAGADAVGFLVGIPSSPRNLTLKRAKRLISKVPVFVDSVIVTAPKSIEWLTKICEKLKPSAIQIHGKDQFDSSIIHKKIKDARLIKTVYVTEDAFNEGVREDLKMFDAVLLDSFVQGQCGGTGKVHDWTLSRQLKEAVAPIPVILAGGLKPENIKKAILAVEPYAVDVASGVEASPGVKDHNKVWAFVENVKQTKLND